MTSDQTAFWQFEQDGWRTCAPVYHDAIAGVNSQSIGPMLAAAHVGTGSEVLDLGLPEGTPFHRFSEADESARTLVKAGFTDCGFESVPQTWRMSDANALYEGLSRASVRMKTVFQMQTPEIQGQLRSSMAAAVSAQATADGQYQLEMPAALSWGRKS